MPAEHSSDGADWRVERSCPICWAAFAPTSPKHRYCSDRCRKAGHARRHAQPAHPSAARSSTTTTRPPATVAVRDCPHCGSAVSIVALLTTPEAARPSTPESGVIPLRRA